MLRTVNLEDLQRISPQERTFIKLVCDLREWTYMQIADRMGVSVSTVEGYFRSLGTRFDLHSRAGLVAFAFEYDLAK